ASLLLTVYALPDTGGPVRVDLSMHAADATGVTVDLSGSLAVKPLEGAIPFPPEILSE
ncbi:hypothetical protein H9Q17_12910, partial [Symbiobacterium thermophilum]